MATGGIKTLLTSMTEEIEKEAATSILEQHTNEIRSQKINWKMYHESKMIADEDYEIISNFETRSQRDKCMREKSLTSVTKMFYNLLSQISKDDTIQVLLVLLDDLLFEDRGRVDVFKEYFSLQSGSCWPLLLNLLNRPNGFINHITARILSKWACWSKNLMEYSDLKFYLTWLKEQLRATGNEYLQSVARCFQNLLRFQEYRTTFVELDGITTIVSLLASRINFQIQYQMSFCLWVLTFTNSIAEKLNKYGVIPILADILSDAQKEKVIRIILAVFKNLIEKPEDPQVIKENCISMVQCKVMKQLEFIEQRKFDDEDITADVEFLKEKMETSLQDLSSYDEYVTEIRSGRLEWSPVHRSEKFWRENSARLNDANYELLKILISLLETCKDPLVLSVACFDLGEYVRHYQRGKHVLEQLKGKTLVMSLLCHNDPNVRYEALLAVQKLMVHNWEYLGRQLEKDQKDTGPKKQIKAS